MADPAVLSRPALIVKIDAAFQARPQSGLDHADVVVEERVEGGIVRFMAIFQSQDTDPVGPVRSVRSTDPPVVAPLGGLFAYSGGIAPFVALLHATGVVDVGASAAGGAYYRTSDRPAPHNLYTSTAALRSHTPPGLSPPPPLFSYLSPGEMFAPAEVSSVSYVQVHMSGSSVGEWDWDATTGRWRRSTDGTPQWLGDGTQETVTNVVVQFVPYRNTGQVDPARHPVDEAVVTGSGAALVLSQGSLASATWSKPEAGDVTTYRDANGAPLRLTPGPTWVMLSPVGSAVTTR